VNVYNSRDPGSVNLCPVGGKQGEEEERLRRGQCFKVDFLSHGETGRCLQDFTTVHRYTYSGVQNPCDPCDIDRKRYPKCYPTAPCCAKPYGVSCESVGFCPTPLPVIGYSLQPLLCYPNDWKLSYKPPHCCYPYFKTRVSNNCRLPLYPDILKPLSDSELDYLLKTRRPPYHRCPANCPLPLVPQGKQPVECVRDECVRSVPSLECCRERSGDEVCCDVPWFYRPYKTHNLTSRYPVCSMWR